MKWAVIAAAVLATGVALAAAVGAMLPRTHRASRTLRLKRAPADVWPVIIEKMRASDVPVDILEQDPPRRLVTRVKETETMFGGTWVTTIAPEPAGGSSVTIVEDGWVGNPIIRVIARFVIGHHATMDGLLKKTAKALGEQAVLSGK